MWKISGNGLTKPSYIYGTMHISGKMVFHLGEPFYQALNEVDVVALELEPEMWLEAIFNDKSRKLLNTGSNKWTSESSFGLYSPAIPLRGQFTIHPNLQQQVKERLMFDPILLNYLLFRSNEYGVNNDYEENTWLDMHIYQTGKKLGKKTVGLETYDQSNYYLKKARKEEFNATEKKFYDAKDRAEKDALMAQLEPAYRRQDLDLIDSLNKRTTSAAFYQYILIERNLIFVSNIDSLLRKGNSVFAGMGCAHLPGTQGIIELLRQKGYTIEPYQKGEHSAKTRNKLETQLYKRSGQLFQTADKSIALTAPVKLHALDGTQESTTWLGLDLPNGASFIFSIVRSYAGLTGQSASQQLNSIDSILYESVAGVIVTKKKITIQGCPGYDIMHKTRAGDYHRSQILVLPESIAILRVVASGEKVRNGYGDEYFSSIRINALHHPSNTLHSTSDGSLQVFLPGTALNLMEMTPQKSEGNNLLYTSYNATTDSYYTVHRLTAEDPDYMDEDTYELNRLVDAFKKDNQLKELRRNVTSHQQLPAMRAAFISKQQKTVHTLFVLQNLNYYAFSAFTTDTLEVNRFFDSIKLSIPSYSHFETHVDSSCFFQVELPYKPEGKPEDDEDEYDWYFASQEDDASIFSGKKASTTLHPPGYCEQVDIHFQRYHRFSDGEDMTTYVQVREKTITQNDYHVLHKKITPTAHGIEMEYVLNDTSSVRRKWIKQILHHKSLYVIEASYDSILGPSEFLRTVFSTLQPLDTTYAYYHFDSMDDAYLNALYSKDSMVQVGARAMSGDMDFAATAAPKIRQTLRNMPITSDDEQKAALKEHLTFGLHHDTSATNLQFIQEEYYKNMDSAYYQIDLLHTLQMMRSKGATLLFKQLILDEPPIVGETNIQTIFQFSQDSLPLGKILMPELLTLTSLNEYEGSIYQLAGMLMDSMYIDPKTIASEIPPLIVQAKTELKRINGSKGEENIKATNKLLNLCRLLHPYRHQAGVDALFHKIYSTRKTSLLLAMVEFDMQHGVAVPDSLIHSIATKDKYIIPLYEMLYRQQQAQRMPQPYANREALLYLYMRNRLISEYDKRITVDSTAIITTEKTVIRGDSLDVYFAKYKRSDSNQWRGVIFLFDATDKNNLWPAFIESSMTIVLDDHENDWDEMEEPYKELIEQNRKQRNFGDHYSEDDWDWY